jgi:hypothetical protein
MKLATCPAVRQLPHRDPDALMDERLRGDQKGKGPEKASVRVKIHEKGHRDPAQRLTADGRQQPERYPGNHDKRNDSPVNELEGRSRKMRAEIQPIQRSAEHERKLLPVAMSEDLHLDGGGPLDVEKAGARLPVRG